MSEIDTLTDRQLDTLERQLGKLYKKAERELSAEIEDYFQAFEDDDRKKQEELEAGEITKEEYRQWRLRVMLSGKNYQALRDKIAERYLKANREAREKINEETPDIFALNYNYSAYEIESEVNGY